eukprot:12909434-Prorocentrum_lima.AAC.1
MRPASAASAASSAGFAHTGARAAASASVRAEAAARSTELYRVGDYIVCAPYRRIRDAPQAPPE